MIRLTAGPTAPAATASCQRTTNASSSVERPDPTLVKSAAEVAHLPEDTTDVLVHVLDDQVATALKSLGRLARLIHSGNSRITDAGVRALATINTIEQLDLEWSTGITDDALDAVASLPQLRNLDLSFCGGVTSDAIARLRARRPDLEIESAGV